MRELCEDCGIAGDRAHVEADERVAGGVLLGVLDPGVEVLLPHADRLTPADVAGYVVALAGRISAGFEGLPGTGGEALEVVFDAGFAGAFVGIDQTVVLVGLEGLLA